MLSFSRSILALGLLTRTVLGAAVLSTPFAIKSTLDAPPRDWVLHSKPHPEHRITLRIALAQPDFPKLESELYAISEPSSDRWTEHLTKEQVANLIAPSEESLSLLDAYLAHHGIDVNSHKGVERTSAKDWLMVPMTVEQAERFLETEYFVYKHSKTGKTVVRTTSYSLPKHLHAHVEDIQPTNYFGGSFGPLTSGVVVEDESKAGAAASTGPFNVTLEILKELYKTKDYKPAGKGLLGVTGYLEQYANLADLAQFYKINLGSEAAKTKLRVELVNGAINSQNASLAGVEANLDVQTTGGLSFPITNIFYSTYGRGQNTQPNISYEDNGNEPYDVFLRHLLNKPDSELPQVLSTSYGEGETEVPLPYAQLVCKLYAQVGARGVSAFHASGDGGVGNGDNTTACATPNAFGAIFPGGCPYVTTVGATVGIPEVAVDFSGGGFSNYFPQPSYQAKQVDSYIRKLGKTYEGLYNPKGRAFPDVSAQGSRFEIVYAGEVVHVSGTSASTPTWAGVYSLVNDALLRAGRRPLGFLNPWLYSLRSGLNDVTSGSNPGCGTEGFNAVEGWDAVTGLGTPNFPGLLKALHL